MKFRQRYFLAFAILASLVRLPASDSVQEGFEDRMFEKQAEYKNAMHHRNDYQASPFYVGDRLSGSKTPTMMRKTQEGEWYPYRTSYLDRPVEIGDEIAIVRTSNTNHTMVKTAYDKKGNIISIHAWDRHKGSPLPMRLDVLAEPIVKDEIESTVAKLRVVYNAYGEVISKAAWNKVTGEKIAVPAAVPFTNYINEDKYWAFVERQKLYERSYEDLYVDRGAVRSHRMRKLVRYGNPFGVPEEIEVYEERPIIERHYEDAHYEADAFIGIFSADFDSTLTGNGVSAKTQTSSKSYIEVGADTEILGHSVAFRYLNLDNSGTLLSGIGNFDGLAYTRGSVFDQGLSDFDFTYRKEFTRGEQGDFGVNWLFSLKYLDMDMRLRDPATGNTMQTDEQVILPTLGFEVIKNMSDHIDLYGQAKVFSLQDTSLTEYYVGGKYYFHPENVNDWRVSLGFKSYNIESTSNDDKIDLSHEGFRVALERGF